MSNQNSWRSITNKLSGLIYIPGILIALFFYQGQVFISCILLTVALSTFIKALGLLNLAKMYGALKRSVWIACIGGLFLPGNFGGFEWIFMAIILSVLLDLMIKPMVRRFAGQNQFSSKRVQPFYVPSTPASSAQSSTYYVPSKPASPAPSYQTYEQGYQAIVQSEPPESAVGSDSAYSQQYEQPQASYPQLLPPPQQ